MKILVIGGTRFSGYFAVEHALASGHEVTLFNRGKSDPEAFPTAEKIIGDRDADVEKLRGRTWDAVIDMAGYVPRVVRKSTELLADVGRYLFVSTISVYADGIASGADEDAVLSGLSDPTTEEVSGENYGGLKVLCENVVTQTFGARATIVRPCVIVGPRDPTNRFDYWVERIAAGGEVLAPMRPSYPMEYIDARDLGEWMIRLLESDTAGVFNALGPANPPLTLGAFFDACNAESGGDARFTWLNETFLLEQKISPWAELPFWATEADKAHCEMRNDRAIAAGLTFRPLATTIQDTLTWVRANPQIVNARRTAITRERETEALQAWHNSPASLLATPST